MTGAGASTAGAVPVGRTKAVAASSGTVAVVAALVFADRSGEDNWGPEGDKGADAGVPEWGSIAAAAARSESTSTSIAGRTKRPKRRRKELILFN
jgi:hypothetical protein